ncbi:MAG: Ig-like domain-containing protein, partial [Pseudomonadota bacterium]
GGGGGGVGLGGALYSDGTVTLERCVFEGNAALPGMRGINHFKTGGFEINDSNPVTADDSRRGSAVFVSSSNLTIIDEIQFGLNSRVNASGQTVQVPTTPSAFAQAPAEIHPPVGITRSAGPAAQTFPQLDNSGHPRLAYIFRNINDTNASDPDMDAENSNHFGVTVTELFEALAGFQVIDSNTLLTEMGIAITGVDTSNGVWDYRLASGSTEYVVIEGVSETNALLLPPDAFVRFTAFPEYTTETGPEPSIEFRAWDDAGNAALINTFADTSSNGGGTSFSTEIARVHQPVDVALKWFAQYLELPDGSQLVPGPVDPMDPPPEPQALARFSRYEVKTAGNPNQASTIVGVGGVYAAGPVVTSEHANILFSAAAGPGQIASGVLQMASVDTGTFDGFGSQSIFNSPVILHGPQRLDVSDDTAVTEEDQSVLIDVLQNDSDPASAAALTLVSVLTSERGVNPSVQSNQIRYAPRANFHGRDSFLYLARSDDGQRFAVGQVEVTITPVNDAPSFTLNTALITVDEDAGAQAIVAVVSDAFAGTGLERDALGNLRTVDVNGNFTEGRPESVDQALSFEFTQLSIDPTLSFSSQPVLDPTSGDLSFAAAPDAFGTATYSVLVRDSGPDSGNNMNASAAQTITLVVNPINDTPGFSLSADPTVLEDAGPQTIDNFAVDITAGATNENTQTLNFNVILNDNPGLFSTAPSIDATNGRLSFTPADDANGTANITVDLMDDGGTDNGGGDTSPPQTFAINVTAVNDAPAFIVGPDQNLFNDDGPQVIDPWATGISAGPNDESGQTVMFNIVDNTNPTILNGAPVIAADGSLSFAPAEDADGSTTITIELTDDGGSANGGVDTSAAQSFVITVIPRVADLVLTIDNTAMPQPVFGSEYSYILSLSNDGPNAAGGSAVAIDFPDILDLIDDGDCIGEQPDGSLSWDVGQLESGASVQCVFSVRVLVPGTIVLSATASSDLDDPLPDNNTNISSIVIGEILQIPTLSTWALIVLAML